VQTLLRNGGLLTPTPAAAVFTARANEIDRAIVGESARWGDNRAFTDPFTRDDWVTIKDGVLANFFPLRTGIVLDQFAARGWLQSLAAPEFNNYGGEVVPGFDVTITKPLGSPGSAEIYYTLDGSDPRLAGGAANPTAVHSVGPITIDVDTPKQIKARIKDGAEWSALIDATFTLPDPFPVRITELHYHPDNYPGVVDDEDLEFIELTNTGSETVSLDGVQITQFTATGYTFANGISLAPGEGIIVARSPAVFQSVYGTAMNVAPTGYSTANLSNGGERVVLLGPYGETLQDFTYDDIAPWPVSPDGFGPSLEIIDPLGDPANPANWRASSLAGGSPGSAAAGMGDYDRNGSVATPDYNLWSTSFGQSVGTNMGADGNGDAVIDAADFVLWRKLFEASPGSGAAVEQSSNSQATIAPNTATAPSTTPAVDKESAIDARTFFAVPTLSENIHSRRLTSTLPGEARTATESTDEATLLAELLFDSDPSPPRDDPAIDHSLDLSKNAPSTASQDEVDAEIWSDVSWLQLSWNGL
jgi:hypothetical protein